MPHSSSEDPHPLLGRLRSASPARTEFEATISLAAQPYLRGHAVFGQPVLSSSSFAEMGLAAVATLGHTAGPATIENFSVGLALSLVEGEAVSVRTSLTPSGPGTHDFQVESGPVDTPTRHASGRVRQGVTSCPPSVELPDPARHRETALDVGAHYRACRQRGIDYCDAFAAIQGLSRHGEDAWGQVDLPPAMRDGAAAYGIHPVLLDAGPQVLWSLLLGLMEHTYMTVGIDRLHVFRRPVAPIWIRARLRDGLQPTAPLVAADLLVLDAEGNLCLHVDGLWLKAATREQLPAVPERAQTLAIAATFTAEPLAEPLRFWLEALALPAAVNFAPYHQVFQQLLDPESALNRNQAGANLLLVRLDDWAGAQAGLRPVGSATEQEALLVPHARHTLANGAVVASLNAYETDYLYDEIFVEQTYNHPEITLPADACVVDVGANIGMFSLYVLNRRPSARLLAVEPSPHTYAVLQANLALYSHRATALNIGLADEDREADFTFYPHSSVFSGFHADAVADEAAVRAAVRGMLSRSVGRDSAGLDRLTEQFLAGRLERQTHRGQLRPLSALIREQGLTRIDLLKIDAEKSELAILQGIESAHWPLIQQLVMEVHDDAGEVLQAIQDLLTALGFRLQTQADALLGEVGFYTVLATRAATSASAPLADRRAARPELRDTVEEFAQSLCQAAARSPVPWLVALCPGSAGPHTTLVDTLAAAIADEPEVHLLTTADVSQTYPVAQPFDAVAEHAGHIPYTPAYFAALSTTVARKLYALTHPPIKVIVLDCDGTLWDGVCGEVGPTGVRLGPEHHALQAFMVDQYQAGTLICLASKNHETDVWAVFEHHADMPLRREHLTAWRINWDAKSANLQSLADELSISLEQVAFIDDNPVEVAEVQAHCPAALSLQLPRGTEAVASWLRHVWAFDHLHRTAEDRQRTQLYRQDRERKAFRRETLSFAAFLEGLRMTVDIAPLTAADLSRASQLTWRTNQFNLSGERRSEAEIRQHILADPSAAGWTVHVTDRFGDYGMVGLMLGVFAADALEVDSFLLSCRALGRGVEHRMLAQLGRVAQTRGLPHVRLALRPTAKNAPAQAFVQSVAGTAPAAEGTEPGTDAARQVQIAAALAAGATFRSAEQQDVAPAVAPAPTAAVSADPELRNALHRRILTEWVDVAAIQAAVARHRPATPSRPTASSPPPVTPLEGTIAAVWAELLHAEQVGRDDNFFDLGGTSLKLVEVIIELHARLGRELSPLELFKYPTVRTLAEYLAGGSAEVAGAAGGAAPSAMQKTIDRAQQRRSSRRNRLR